MLNIEEILESLSNERPVFHSERDFQFSLGIKIKEKYPEMEIRLEVPMNDDKTEKRVEHIDMKVLDDPIKIGIVFALL